MTKLRNLPSRQYARRSVAERNLRVTLHNGYRFDSNGDKVELTGSDKDRIKAEVHTLSTRIDSTDRPTKKLLAYATEARKAHRAGKIGR